MRGKKERPPRGAARRNCNKGAAYQASNTVAFLPP